MLPSARKCRSQNKRFGEETKPRTLDSEPGLKPMQSQNKIKPIDSPVAAVVDSSEPAAALAGLGSAGLAAFVAYFVATGQQW